MRGRTHHLGAESEMRQWKTYKHSVSQGVRRSTALLSTELPRPQHCSRLQQRAVMYRCLSASLTAEECRSGERR